MGKKNDDSVLNPFLIFILIFTTIWNLWLKSTFKGYFGFRLIITYSICMCCYSVIHNIHYGKFLSIYNPFFTLFVFGGYYKLQWLARRYLGLFIIQGFDWFSKEHSLSRLLCPLWKHNISFVFVIISFIPYVVLFYIIKKEYGNE